MSAGNTNYRRGADFERRVKAKLESEGWTVFRTAGSHSPADLVCLKAVARHGVTVLPRLVQCKGGKTAMTARERASFREFADTLHAEAVVYLRGMKEEWA